MNVRASIDLVDFVFGKGVQKPTTLKESPGYFRQLSNAMPYLARLAAILMLAGVAWLVIVGWWFQVLCSALAAVVAYVILDIL